MGKKQRVCKGSYLAVFHDTDSLLWCEKRQMGETDASPVGEMNETPYLTLLVFHQTFVSDRVNSTHVRVRVLMGVENA